MNLLDLQRRMSEDVRRPLDAEFDMVGHDENGRSLDDIAESYIRPNDRLSSFERLEIYNRQYWFRVISAVSEDFPALNAILGQKRFDTLILAYLRDTPSTSFTLRNLSASLPTWLASWLAANPRFAPRRHALLLDVARLEWAYVETYDRATVPPLTLDDFAAIGPDSRLHLQPHLQLLDLQYEVDELVLAVHRETPAAEVVSNAVTERKTAARIQLPRMKRSPIYLAVHRHDNSVYYRRIEREAFLLLSALQRHHTLSEAIDLAFAKTRLKPDQQAATIQGTFAHAAELGWFCPKPPDHIGLQ